MPLLAGSQSTAGYFHTDRSNVSDYGFQTSEGFTGEVNLSDFIVSFC